MTIRTMLLAATALATAGPGHAFTLHVLHINDFHSRIEAVNKYNTTCTAEEEEADECYGGAARLHTAINSLRDELVQAGENVLVLAAGDSFQGSLFFTTYSGEAELEFMNNAGFDAMVLGNHEFDLGIDPLAAFISEAKFPVIFGNTDASQDATLEPLNPDPVVLDVGGEKVAILGAVTADTPEISSPGPSVSFSDPVQHLSEAAAALEANGVRHILALTHVGTPEDERIASAVPDIDAVIGGHSHTLFSNTIDGAAYRYPLMTAGANGTPVPIVQAGEYSKYLGHLVLEFDESGVVTSATGDTKLIDASVAPDPGVSKRVEEMAGPIEELRRRVVAEVSGDIDGSRESCRTGECAMGNLVADAMLDRVKAQGARIAIQNGGGLRASIGSGEVTKGDILTVLPFQNTLSTFNLSGAGIVAALENGVSQVEEGGGRFPQVAGLKFTWDPSVEPMGGRVQEVMVREGEEWVPIEPDKIYSVVTNNFLRNGGDGYTVMSEEGSNSYDHGPNLEDVVSDYLSKRQGYEPFTDQRIATVE